MRIEKLNDNQIRCILDKNDLAQRDLHLSELAYGSSKAKALFKDMMEQAAMEFGFETGDNIPLMIEAIPVSPECLILVVTKVDDPEELDTRFSRFSSLTEEAAELMNMDPSELEFEEELPFEATDFEDSDEEEIHFSSASQPEQAQEGESTLDVLGPFNKALERAKEEIIKKKSANAASKPLSDEIYVFDSLDSVIEICGHLSSFYEGDSILYKDTVENEYFMILLRQESSKEYYQRACNLCADHGDAIMASYATPAYFKEHFQLICGSSAIETLSQLS